MKSQLQALVIIAVAFAGLTVVIVGTVLLQGVTCACGSLDGFPPSCLQNPCPGHELLYMDSYRVNSPTNATLTIRNIGQWGIGFSAYWVSQSSGASFINKNWTEPMLPPSQVLNANIIISGASFTFQSGTIYTVTIVTQRNNQFTFTIQP